MPGLGQRPWNPVFYAVAKDPVLVFQQVNDFIASIFEFHQKKEALTTCGTG